MYPDTRLLIQQSEHVQTEHVYELNGNLAIIIAYLTGFLLFLLGQLLTNRPLGYGWSNMVNMQVITFYTTTKHLSHYSFNL